MGLLDLAAQKRELERIKQYIEPRKKELLFTDQEELKRMLTQFVKDSIELLTTAVITPTEAIYENLYNCLKAASGISGLAVVSGRPKINPDEFLNHTLGAITQTLNTTQQNKLSESEILAKLKSLAKADYDPIKHEELKKDYAHLDQHLDKLYSESTKLDSGAALQSIAKSKSRIAKEFLQDAMQNKEKNKQEIQDRKKDISAEIEDTKSQMVDSLEKIKERDTVSSLIKNIEDREKKLTATATTSVVNTTKKEQETTASATATSTATAINIAAQVAAVRKQEIVRMQENQSAKNPTKAVDLDTINITMKK